MKIFKVQTGALVRCEDCIHYCCFHKDVKNGLMFNDDGSISPYYFSYCNEIGVIIYPHHESKYHKKFCKFEPRDQSDNK